MTWISEVKGPPITETIDVTSDKTTCKSVCDADPRCVGFEHKGTASNPSNKCRFMDNKILNLAPDMTCGSVCTFYTKSPFEASPFVTDSQTGADEYARFYVGASNEYGSAQTLSSQTIEDCNALCVSDESCVGITWFIPECSILTFMGLGNKVTASNN